ncbi:MAG: glutamine--fructose-6-phosphate transaminase (isomerizing) [Holosporaceae bacterium]|jgi:glucosamine--fructose-6-phosphate aminotransferase (isomerizing)|nr:glutamine--fructose-6-phosphate transaminase (isomerizing) [Holosporaceae bacterium]
MCGIVGILGKSGENVLPSLLNSLEKLEYRGYDSTGIALSNGDGGSIIRVRSAGKLFNLKEKLQNMEVSGSIGIGHTRWATHGEPSEKNAHPMISTNLAVVHNGIVENYKKLKFSLENDGYIFTSDTDTEVIAHLIQRELFNDFSPVEAVQRCLSVMDGALAIAVVFADHKKIVAARRKGSLVIGFGEHVMCVGSDIGTISQLCQEVSYPEDTDIIEISENDAVFFGANFQKVDRPKHEVEHDPCHELAETYSHFTLQEIMDQPSAIRKTMLYNQNKIDESILEGVNTILILACGTSYHAGMVAKYWFEYFLKIQTNVEIASEFRYRSPIIADGTLVISISQSGETIDTLAALEYASSNGNCKTVAIVNVKNSSTDRSSNVVYYAEAGVERGVASTKAFTAQLTILASLAFCRNWFLRQQLQNIPTICEAALSIGDETREVARIISKSSSAIYLGRGNLYPIALEGALKLKEISYIHAEGFAAGEMKHGPIALIDERMPVLFLCPHNELFEKTFSNMQEVLARGKNIIAITDAEGEKNLPSDVRRLVLPTVCSAVAPIIYSIPLQLLAYYTALELGTDVDRPRNLAKSVTVE